MKKTIDFMSKSSKWLLVFGIVFSQLAFPLSALADEVVENKDEENTYTDITLDNEKILENEEVIIEEDNRVDTENEEVVTEENTDVVEDPVDTPEIDKNIITINGEETDIYIINPEDSKIVSIAIDGEEIANFDFSNKLYGTYQYTIESLEKNITIQYNGNNADILKNYELAADLSKKIKYDDSNCVIAGLNTITDIKEYYDLEKFMTDYSAELTFTRDGIILEDTNTINTLDKLEIITNDNTDLVRINDNSSYIINKLGDLNADNTIDKNDQEIILIDIEKNNAVSIFNDINGDGILDILDATDSLFITNDSSIKDTTDTLKSIAEISSAEAVIGEEVKVSLKISGFTNTSLYGIEGSVNYDNTILELVDANINSINKLGCVNGENNRFAFAFDKFNNNDDALLVLTFKAIASGNVDITISNLVASYGSRYNLENDTTTVSLNVLDYGKGGDVDNNTMAPIVTTNQEEVTATAVQVVNTVKTNNDIDSYKEDKNTKEETKSLKKNKKKDNDEEETEKNSTSKTIIIILIILVIIGLIYVIFKDDEEESTPNSENKIKANEKSSKKSNKK